MKHTCTCGEPTQNWLCDKCALTLAWSIVNIAADYTDLATIATKQTRYTTTGTIRSSIGQSQPLPVDYRFTATHSTWSTIDGLPVVDDTTSVGSRLRADTENTITAWTHTVQAEQPTMAGPVHVDCLDRSCSQLRRRRPPRPGNVPSQCHYLARNHHWCLSQTWAPQLLDEFLNLEHRLSWFVDRPADRWYAGKCVCGAELYATVERGSIDCSACGISHDVASRRTVLLAEAKDYLVTATEAAGALLAWTDYDGSEKKLIDRIRKWRDRRRLPTHGQVDVLGVDRWLYRLGDVQVLMVELVQLEHVPA